MVARPRMSFTFGEMKLDSSETILIMTNKHPTNKIKNGFAVFFSFSTIIQLYRFLLAILQRRSYGHDTSRLC